MQGQQMLLAGMAVARGRRFYPFGQALLPLRLGKRAGASLDEPVLKGLS